MPSREIFFVFIGGFFGIFLLMYDIQHCLCRALDSTAGIEPGTVATTELVVRRSNHSARSHPQWMENAVRIGTWYFFLNIFLL